MPTLEDVARLAGVSTATVSRTLNSPDRVRTETRLAVENAVAVLGYTPNFGGQALASRRSNTIGAIIPTMANSIFATAVQALQETLAARNVMLLVASSQYSPMREQTQLRTLLARGVDGIALIGSERPPEVYDILESRRVPFALLWSAPRASSHLTIGFDNAAAASEVARNVLAAGHRRIALLTGMIEGNDRARARLQGVTEELARAGITLDPGDIVALPYTLDDGEAGAIRLLSRPDRPTAIICGNDVLAAGAMRGARAMGLSIPGDVSVTGFDDIELATAVSPALTTVRVPHRRMGEAAGQALLEWIETGQQPRSIGFPAEFIARSSLGRPPGG
ncbi:LacI family DNA-binding transcriptional regulator [Paracoccus sp. 1_MG-2023]|uniref:LacI family DNA-binding transcriptional regulator n=1 Tax=unclassified Paracoccus (in: a-proteobacteria) TaxID=2688777 RepID=UPI0026E3C2B6|nr:LacI family DNA-binding transcriptional regulator [Paracoccus sp. 1_MG-2023]MDO6668932.1 LacI family DNA-binding transcriptional regulator [Paracoccus sp. 1_MG-2023]